MKEPETNFSILKAPEPNFFIVKEPEPNFSIVKAPETQKYLITNHPHHINNPKKNYD